MLIHSLEEINEVRKQLDLPDDLSDEKVDQIISQTDKLADIFINVTLDKEKETRQLRSKQLLKAKGYSKKDVDEFFVYQNKVLKSQLEDLDHKRFENIRKDYIEISQSIDVSDRVTI